MIRDSFLTVCLDKKPTLPSQVHTTIGSSAATYGTPVFYALPNPDVLNTLIDLQVAMDLGQGNPLTARFEISTTFAALSTGSTANDYSFSFAVIAATPATLSPESASGTTASLALDLAFSGSVVATGGACLVKSRDFTFSQLVKNTVIELTLPPLPDLTVKGYRFLSLGMYLASCFNNTNPPTNFTAGGINAFLLPHSQGPITHHNSGFAVAAGGV